jgi:hypothetical protein
LYELCLTLFISLGIFLVVKNSLSVYRRLLLSERVPVPIPDKISDYLLRILIFLCVKCDLSLRVDQSVIVRRQEDLSADRWITLS